MTNKILFLSAQDVKEALPMNEAIAAMRTAFSRLSSGRADAPLRTALEIKEEDGIVLFMPAYLPGQGIVSLKTVTVYKNNPAKHLPMIHALVTVFDAETGRPLAVMDGEELTAVRTGAAAGLASDLLSRQDSAVLAVIGAGRQAVSQVDAVLNVRKIQEIIIIDKNYKRAEDFAVGVRDKYDVKTSANSDPSVIKIADIICTVTSSLNPVFSDKDLKEGAHINAMGSYRPDMQEVPAETMGRSLVVVDSREACLQEAGDLIMAVKQGKFLQENIYAELGEIVSKKFPGRKNEKQITLFKSVGNAVQDLMAAQVIIKNAKRLNLGQIVDL